MDFIAHNVLITYGTHSIISLNILVTTALNWAPIVLLVTATLRKDTSQNQLKGLHVSGMHILTLKI